MELEMPAEVRCLLCDDETVKLRENRKGNPYFSCTTFNAAVNLRPETDSASKILHEAVEDGPEEGREDESAGATVEDLLGGEGDG